MDNAAKKKETAIRFDAIRKEYKAGLNRGDYPGTLSMIFDLDVPVCVYTMDNETFVGELTSFDQFGNIVLSKARSRYVTAQGVEDTSYGTCYFRSEQIMLLGPIDKEKESELFKQFKITPPEDTEN
ncbi:Sm protein [Tritrichomonas foetus]|uniref:Sm protein n=1 Tax=Tritrichomonas foetus TaxID=1144522 RepID=A0A1J4J9U2_9EUKA|nr:Sm protein [Tritrichomonas foetus]|eukprot:OHS95962.1 Sm protein [Tritrichomonas foetus]